MVKLVKSLPEFQSELSSAGSKLVVVDFTATWCGPCRMIAPEFERLSKEMSDVVFLKVDVDEAAEVSAFCKIKCMPTFQFYKNGEKIDQFEGASVPQLKACLTKYK